MVERFFTTTRSLLNQSVNFPFCACVLTTTKRLRLRLRTIPIGARFVTSKHFPLYTLEYATLVNIDEDGNNEDDNDEEMAEKGVEKEKDWKADSDGLLSGSPENAAPSARLVATYGWSNFGLSSHIYILTHTSPL